MKRRVAITGLGVISALGRDVAEALTVLREGRSTIAFREQEGWQAAPVPVAAVPGYSESDYFRHNELLMLDRATQFAIIAGDTALSSSAVMKRHHPERVAVVVGTGTGGGTTVEENYLAVQRNPGARLHPMCVPKLMINASASQLTIRHGITGPSYVIASACASSAHAIANAYHLIVSGIVDAAVTGGAESCLSPGQIRAWEGLRIMASDTCRPFSLGRRGLVLGEGAAILVLEDYELAARSGVKILGELLGVGMSSDAVHIVQPTVAGCAAAMEACLASAELSADEVQYVNAHGTGTAANDRTEAAALQQVFGTHLDSMMVSSTKSAHGHCIGAAGAIELCASLVALREGFVPATVNFLEPDPLCPIDCVPNVPRQARVTNFISNSFAFGGHNASVAVQVESASA